MACKGRAREGRGTGRCGGRATGHGAGLGLRGLGGARSLRHDTAAAAAVFVQLALRCGCNWAARWHLARPVGKHFRGCRAKRPYVNLKLITLIFERRDYFGRLVGFGLCGRLVGWRRWRFLVADAVQPELVKSKRKKTTNLPSPIQRRGLLRGCALDLRLLHPQVNSRGSESELRTRTRLLVCLNEVSGKTKQRKSL